MSFWVRLTVLDFLLDLPTQRKQPMFFFPFSLRSRLKAKKAQNGPKHEKEYHKVCMKKKKKEKEDPNVVAIFWVLKYIQM